MKTQNTWRGFTQKEKYVVKKIVIPNLIWNLQRLPLPFINNPRGRSRIKYGMTPLFFKEEALNKNAFRAPLRSGFTLIELLVVVLIIGILAAVAVPQYQKAVDKSRMASMMPLVRSLADAKRLYVLANGVPTTSIENLDISIPGVCEKRADSYYIESISCGKFTIQPNLDALYSVSGWLDLSDGTQLRIYANDGDILNRNTCTAISTKIGRADEMCKSFATFESSGVGGGSPYRRYVF